MQARGTAGVLTGVRGRVRRLGRRRRRLGGVGRRARAGGRRRRIFRGAGGGRGRVGGRRAERDQPQQRHAPPPEHGGQRAGSAPYAVRDLLAPDAARGLLATEIRAPLDTGAPTSSLRYPAGLVRRRDGWRGDAGARARPHGDWGAAPESVRPRPNTISGATLRAAAAARPPHAANFTRNCGRAVMRYVPRRRHLHLRHTGALLNNILQEFGELIDKVF